VQDGSKGKGATHLKIPSGPFFDLLNIGTK